MTLSAQQIREFDELGYVFMPNCFSATLFHLVAAWTTCAAVLALRFQLAALYLGLAAGTTGGSTTYAPAKPRE